MVTVVGVNGRVHSGVMRKAGKQADPIRLVQADGEELTLPRDDVEELREVGTSAMPSNFADQLTVRQLADLVAFLSKRRRPGTTRQKVDSEATRVVLAWPFLPEQSRQQILTIVEARPDTEADATNSTAGRPPLEDDRTPE